MTPRFGLDEQNLSLLNFKDRYKRMTTARVNTEQPLAYRPKTVEEWNTAVETAIQECVECLRKGEEMDWSKYSWIIRKTTILTRAKVLLKAEQDAALFDSAFTIHKGSVYQYLMLLCLLLGVLGAKPVVAFRDTESKTKSVEVTK